MKILLVNDDGYYAEGLQRLKKELDKIGEVFVCAPKEAMSAKSCSITISHPIEAQKIDDHNYIVDGTPADCAEYGCLRLNQKFDLVVSGCNDGLNCSRAIMWSGTIGACLQAQIYGYPCVAFSAKVGTLDFIEMYTLKVLEFIFENDLLSPEIILNVNYPYKLEQAKGLKISEVDINKRVDFDLEGHELINVNDDGSYDYNFKNENGDLYHLSHGFISIAPLHYSYGNRLVYEEIKNKVKKDFDK